MCSVLRSGMALVVGSGGWGAVGGQEVCGFDILLSVIVKRDHD